MFAALSPDNSNTGITEGKIGVHSDGSSDEITVCQSIVSEDLNSYLNIFFMTAYSNSVSPTSIMFHQSQEQTRCLAVNALSGLSYVLL